MVISSWEGGMINCNYFSITQGYVYNLLSQCSYCKVLIFLPLTPERWDYKDVPLKTGKICIALFLNNEKKYDFKEKNEQRLFNFRLL